MGFLDWMKRSGSHESPAGDNSPAERPGASAMTDMAQEVVFPPERESRYFTRKGDPIHVEASGKWTDHESGLYATRGHIGKSAEGFHGGFEVSLEKGAIEWSHAESTAVEAQRNISVLRENWNDFSVEGYFKTKNGNDINSLWAEEWCGNEHYVFNERVGLSDEGYHGGVTVSWKQCPGLETYWGDARENVWTAQSDAAAIRVSRCREMDQEIERTEHEREM